MQFINIEGWKNSQLYKIRILNNKVFIEYPSLRKFHKFRKLKNKMLANLTEFT
jgi:hypothetical protein